MGATTMDRAAMGDLEERDIAGPGHLAPAFPREISQVAVAVLGKSNVINQLLVGSQ